MKAPSSASPVLAGCRPNQDFGEFSLAIIVCTRDRLQSLRRTLESLSAADRAGIALRIVVVNNSACHEIEDVVRGFQPRLPICLVSEERPGKCFALDRGILECGGAEIIAVVDDDITIESGWLQGVREITHRWPNKGFFAGSSFIVWPDEDVPTWARDPSLSPWAYSVLATDKDRMIRPNCWASGNCFWFRASLLPRDYRFCETWLTEPPLMLDFAERGFGGVVAPDARAWHHLTADMLDIEVIRRRAILVGRAFAAARLVPYRKSVWQAALFHRHPLLCRGGCGLLVLRWMGAWMLAHCSPSADKRIVRTIEATQKIAGYRQYLASCRGVREYGVRIPFSDRLSC
jgi:glycosyltransferase involved in cell wall biosynthesis